MNSSPSLIVILCLLALSSFVFAQEDMSCSTCVCAGDVSVARGDQLYVCIQYMQYVNGGMTLRRAAYPIIVDQYSAVELRGAHAQYGFPSPQPPANKVDIIVQVGSKKSFNIHYLQANEDNGIQFYSNLYSIVIQLDNGNVQDVIWDNRCANCDSDNTDDSKDPDACQTLTFSNGQNDYLCNKIKKCASQQPTPCPAPNDGQTCSPCDPKVYVSFLGTDKNGLRMTSAGLRLARWRSFSKQEMYTSAGNLVQFMARIPEQVKSYISGENKPTEEQVEPQEWTYEAIVN